MEFTADVLGRIQHRIDVDPGVSRVKLSRAVCGMLGWRAVTGRLKEMSCRVALLKLHRRGLLRLPPVRPGPPRAWPRGTTAGPPPARPGPPEVPIRGPLASLGTVELVPIGRPDTAAARRWAELMDRYHYLGSGPLCGAQLRYLIRSQRGEWLGGLAFSAAAYAVAARDRWIGWDAAARRAHLEQVVCNSRFLLLPHVMVPHLASHVLGLAARRLPADWRARYGYPPVLLETFVGRRFRGTCYRAANWIAVGQTRGRGRQDRRHRRAVGAKRVFVLPLRRDARAVLGRAPAAPVSVPPRRAPTDWAAEEFGAARLGDARLARRLQRIARDFFAQPQASIPQACQGRAKTKATYRFLEHPETTMDAILQPHYAATHQRMQAEATVLAVQDTTDLNYATHRETAGLGPIGSQKDGAVGLLVHDTLAITPDGRPLGLLDVQCWARDAAAFGKRARRYALPIAQKESQKWLRSYAAAARAQHACPGTRVISVGDREADLYELFARARDTAGGPDLLVRARQDRVVAEGQGHLWDTLTRRPVAARVAVTIPRRGARPARTAVLEVRFATLSLRPPKRKPRLGPVTLAALAAQERGAPAGVEPVEWFLLTTLPLATGADATTVLTWYSRRWGIEVYHRTLKSGCKIEERQLGSAERLEACLAIDMVVAWRIYYLTKLGRETPDVPCTVFFEDFEWKALVAYLTQEPTPPAQPPTLRAALRMVATLGGFLGRKGDGEPGTKTTWLGLQRLDDLAAMFKFMALRLAPHLLRPPVSSPSGYG